MVHDVQAIREDLAFMRALAQEGRRAPVLIGPGLLISGVVYGLTSLLAWAICVRLVALPGWWEGAVWWAVTVVYVPAMWAYRRAYSCRKPGATALTNRAIASAWRGIGYAFMAVLVASVVIAYRFHSTMAFIMIPTLIVAVYGAAWLVAGAMSGLSWLNYVAAACFVIAVLLAVTAGLAMTYFVFAAAMFGLLALPGWLLMRSEPSEVV